jgi:hypothetical protein
MSEQITWVCEVCGKNVSKRQSLALPTGGRACKIHESVQDTVKAKQLTDNVNAAKKKNAEEEEQKRRRHRFDFSLESMQEKQIHNETHCWVCNKPGFKQSTIPQLMLLGMAKLEEKGIPFDILKMPGQVYEELGIVGMAVLFEINVEGASIKYYDRLHFDFTRVIPFAPLCMECIEKLGLKHRVPKLEPPNPSMETLSIMGAVYETSGMKEEMHRNAATLIAMENAGSPKNVV